MPKQPALYLIVLSGLLVLNGCTTSRVASTTTNPATPIQIGMWRFCFDLGEATLPVQAEYDGAGIFTIHNASESIVCTPATFKGDSVFFRAPVFDNIFKGVVSSAGLTITGSWYNLSKKNYVIPFRAERFSRDFKPAEQSPESPLPSWEVVFSPGTRDMYKAIGVFRKSSQGGMYYPNQWEGTFMTETGDYRFLSGYRQNDSLVLTGFDGSHVFCFRAGFYARGDSLRGIFYSGIHWQEPWIAGVNPGVELSDPDSLTHMVHRDSVFHFRFPDLNGTPVSFPSTASENKVTIIQIMGSWCPNCLDETRYLAEVHGRYHKQGLDVIALCFERSDDFALSVEQVTRLKKSTAADYTFLIAGKSGKKSAAEKLPMLDHIMSFPTTIYIDKKGKVRKIYTGYYGPSTGNYYLRYQEETDIFIRQLLNE